MLLENKPLTDSVWFENADKQQRWLAGVSGGADSMALLHLLAHYGFQNIIVCHLDHQLRAEESAADAELVRSHAENLHFSYEASRTAVRELAARNRQSLECAARHARHVFFISCSEKYNCSRLLLAHHSSDQAETVLWNLLRGSHGAKGMRMLHTLNFSEGRVLEIYRPLLGCSREELRSWLRKNNILWREDATNAEAIAIRNRLRNEVIPLLKEITSRDVVAMLVRAAEDGADMAEVEDWALRQTTVYDPQGRLYLPALKALPVSLQRAALARYFANAKIPTDRRLITEALRLLHPTGPHSINLPNHQQLRRKEERIFIKSIVVR